jgi:hypothetical protein
LPYYICLEVREITARKDGAIFKTKPIGYHWFRSGRAPETQTVWKVGNREFLYAFTGKDHLGIHKPEDTCNIYPHGN